MSEVNADGVLLNPHESILQEVQALTNALTAERPEGLEEDMAAPVEACDLRAGAALVVAALAAQGVSEVGNIRHVERGYEDIVAKLTGIGAQIEVVDLPDPQVENANAAG